MMEQKEKDLSLREMRQTLRALASYLYPHRLMLAAMVFLGLLGTLGELAIAFFPDQAIRRFIEPMTTEGIGPFLAAYLAVLVLRIFTDMTACFLACKVELYVDRDLRNAAFHHLQELSVSYFNVNSVGYIHARVMSDTERIGSLVSWNLMEGVWNLSYLLGAILVMIWLKPSLALAVLALVPVTVLLSAWFQKRLTLLGRQIREYNGRITGAFNEGITGVMTIKTLAVEEDMDRQFRKETEGMQKTAVKNGHMRGCFVSMISFSGFAALALVLWQGGALTRAGLLELGTLSVFVSYALGMMEPVRWSVKAISDFITVRVNVERLDRLLHEEPDVKDDESVTAVYGDSFHPNMENWEKVKGDLVFDDVTFRYPDGTVNVLEHFNLTVPRGTVVAIVGETGAGKSTLVNLVCRFFEPTGGRILLDGRDLRERSRLWLHRQIGYVLQTPHLFSGSVLDNLRFGRPEASMEEVEAAVRLVHAEGIIERMENGYRTDVGEGGSRLSAGERQLISLARALISDPAIFVLDEATSAIDTETESALQAALEEVMAGRTSFVIAHRLSTIRRADMILVVHDGKIIEQGDHRSLMKKKGAYWELYTRQYEAEAF